MGDPCLRRLVLDRTKGDAARPYGPGLVAIFRDGETHEDDVKRFLASELGLRLQGSQRSFPANAYQLTGHIDAEHVQMFEGQRVAMGVEIKGLNAYDWDALRARGAAAMLEIPRLRRYYHQGQAYMLMQDLNAWVFVVKNKATGQLWAFVMPEDVSCQQEILDRAAVINDYVQAGTTPDYIRDRTECLRCKYLGGACQPPDDAPGMAVLHDAGLAVLANVVVDDQEAAKRHGRALEALRGALEVFLPAGKDGERMVALGRALIHLKLKKGRRTMKVVPLEAKKDGNDEESAENG